MSTTSKFHYIGPDGIALCRKWARVGGVGYIEEGNDAHSDNCAACQKKKLAATAKLKTS